MEVQVSISMEPTHILLIEDDPNDVELILIALNNFNFVNRIHHAQDGEQALQFLLGYNGETPLDPLPRLVLLDLKLPKINGIEVLEAIRSHPTTQHLVVVVMTSSAENQDLEACYNLGVNSYIVKPLDFQQFFDVSRQVGFYWMMLNQISPQA